MEGRTRFQTYMTNHSILLSESRRILPSSEQGGDAEIHDANIDEAESIGPAFYTSYKATKASKYEIKFHLVLVANGFRDEEKLVDVEMDFKKRTSISK